MPSSKRCERGVILVVLMLMAICGGCENTRALPGGYTLQKWEDGVKYYIIGPDGDQGGGGVVDGTVKKIGWNPRFIVAWRYSTFRGDLDGWMIIDCLTHRMWGPLSDEQLRSRDDVKDVAIYDAAEAWAKLGR